MRVERFYTNDPSSPTTGAPTKYVWRRTSVRLEGKDGKVICDVPNLIVPEHWSRQAATILAHKYLFKADIPHIDVSFERSFNDASFFKPYVERVYKNNMKIAHGEHSAEQVFHRMAAHWAYSGINSGYLTFEDALVYYDEMFYMLYHQIGAPNSPQWFNTGIWWAYGLGDEDTARSSSNNVRYRATASNTVSDVTSNYKYPQTSACFILGLKDSLVGKDGILDRLKDEAVIFKYGSGSGINYSSLRSKGSPLNNGGHSSGMMSFMNVFDANAGVIKSGGTTRRAARMAVVDASHPEAHDFVRWKAKEQIKLDALVIGANAIKQNVSDNNSYINQQYDTDVLNELTDTFESEAYATIGGQNANNSLRVDDNFMRKVVGNTLSHDDGDVALWRDTVRAAWRIGDPGLQFHDTCNRWHTIPKVAEQRATNPCGEFAFIDDTSCNLASINLIKFIHHPTKNFDAISFAHAVRLWTLTLDITINMSSYPTESIALNSYRYRPLGLGYANLGAMLMTIGVAYDSDAGRSIAAIITALMHFKAWETSILLGDQLGTFYNCATLHHSDVYNVFMQHYDAFKMIRSRATRHFNEMHHNTGGYNFNSAVDVTENIASAIYTSGNAGHVRNSQLTLLAPTGTIGLVMDCDTTGIEPLFSPVTHKSLAGGGSMLMIPMCVQDAVENFVCGSLTCDKDEDTLNSIMNMVDDIKSGRPNLSIADVVACANDISPMGHVMMMSTVQPFLSGSISKTINMPNAATVDDVETVLVSAWAMGIKAITVFRDKCRAQPLHAVTTNAQPAQAQTQTQTQAALPALPVNTNTPKRKHLPSRRKGFTQKADISGHKIYLRTGEYEDGTLGEIFLTIAREGSTTQHLLNAFARMTSVAIQHGVPLNEIIDSFRDDRAEPSGVVCGSDNVRFCTSIVDYVMRELSAAYGNNVPIKESADTVSPAPALVIRHMTHKSERYVGATCLQCDSTNVIRNGSCFVCKNCGNTTGCS